ncbi:protein FAR1-RELATED SEQUENCE 5-like [Salvia miltiorrhiza]|uniref:protein FAR1-RELATED SEQUENCE 5-like n=1 Tax=Salvia miltiorrhiza TaxID=226208 RepID=UPI0025ACD706|nr:protein FAR1-RELATED SEQUENCE 5-like [Salvia miltiorrhiza]
MVPTVSRHLMPVNKNVTPAHEMWITSAIKANIGPIRSFRMYREIMGEYEDIGCVNDEKRLCRLIWTDEVSVKNYKLFGEAVSFDATYNTNRYKMIFTPFTGRDNHGKCLSFGAAIISREDVDSYSWVLEKFVECVGNAPPLLITDQDSGLKKAVAADNRWFSDMFDDRSHWIPAYFRDVSMSGLFRTTLLSESKNSYFKRALEAQRHNYHKTTFADETGVLPMKTRLKIEKYAATIYINNIFKEVQDEIDASQTYCNMYQMEEQVDESIYTVHDNVDGKLVVRHRLSDTYTSCSCNLFVRKAKFSRLLAMVPGFELDSAPSQNSVIGNNKIFNVVGNCIGYVGDNQVLREELLAALIEVEKRFAKEGSTESKLEAKHRLFKDFYGTTAPEVPSVLPPLISKMKGSGAGGRRKSNQEKAMDLAKKPLRNCKKCNTMGHHDSRNCPTNKLSN